MSSHPQQLSTQQLEHAIKNLEKRVKAKILECASLGQFRDASADFIGKLFNFRDEEKQKPMRDAAYNYLTAKLNFALVDLEELELTLKAYKSIGSNIVLASGVKIG